MKVLISPVSLEEAEMVAQAGADILDIKNIKEGSLGAQFPWTIKEITARFRSSGIVCSATLGDLPYKPGTAALASYGAAQCGVAYIKAGLHGATTYDEGLDMMRAVVKAARMADPSITMVASGYADFRKFNGLSFSTLVDVARESGSDVAMLDTFYKNGSTLFDEMTFDELEKFTKYAHQSGLKVALAGSINASHLKSLQLIGPDIIGVRGAVCSKNNRKSTISKESLDKFLIQARSVITPEKSLEVSNTNVISD